MTLGPRHGPGQPVHPRGTLDPEYTRSLPTAADTHALGAQVGSVLRPGDLVILDGPLGAGKTVFVQGIGEGLHVSGTVVSPTFVIARVHPPGAGGAVTLVHVDAYRLGSLVEVDDLDLDVDAAEVVTAVEWGAGRAEQLADAHLLVELTRPAESDVRTVTLTPRGGDWAARLATLLDR